ncbi:CHAT domain-containing tetratricopeptide repeat protein [Streptacidiphilus carbonis]|uniref:CHAT domain-containing tetratricopeptide repeat protein n=1 Tax=Streptacidiphilus carbonis TaxID=105422 RepID=UPI0005AA21B2|nr:CHAT domain-containing protein [Streptacidiphilus carbonis]
MSEVEEALAAARGWSARHGEADGIEAVTEAVNLLRRVCLRVGPAERSGLEAHCEFVAALTGAFRATGEPEHLEQAVAHGRQLLSLVPEGAGRRLAQRRLGEALHLCYEKDGDVAALAEGVAVLRRATAGELTPIGEGWSDTGLVLVTALRQLSDEEDDGALLAESEELARSVLAAAAPGTPAVTAAANALAVTLWSRFDRSSQVRDLEGVVAVLDDGASRAARTDPLYVRCAANLGLALRDLHGLTGEASHLRRSVTVLRGVLADARTAHPDSQAIAGNLALALQDLAELTGDIDVLREAAAVLTNVVDSLASDDPESPQQLSNLSALYQDLYEETSDTSLLDLAVRCSQEALERSAADHPSRAAFLTHLGLGLRMRYEAGGDPELLARAIEAGAGAVALAGSEHPKAAIYRSNLGIALRLSYECWGDPAALESAIAESRAALAASDETDSRRPGYASNLALALWTRHEISGDLESLDEAIGLSRQALTLTSEDSHDHARYATNLGLALWTSGARGERGRLDEAVGILREVTRSSPPDHAETIRYLSNLSNALLARHRHSGEPADLDEALEVAEEAAARTPVHHVERPRMLSNLGTLLQTWAVERATPEPFDRAVELFRQAIAESPAGHADNALYRFNLGDALRERAFALPGLPRAAADRAEARLVLAEASDHAKAPVSLRIEAAWAAARLAMEDSDETWALKLFAAAVGLLPRLAPRHLDHRDRERHLVSFLGLASEAAACALAVGDPTQALSLLEWGRGILVDQMADPSTAPSVLERLAKPLARRFTALRGALDRPPGPGDPVDRQARDTTHQLGTRWEELLAEIRAVPGLERFLLPPTQDELLTAAAEGPVVLVNVSRYGCAALLIADGAVTALPLPALSQEHVARYAEDMDVSLQRIMETEGPARRTAERAFDAAFSNTVGWLWDTVAGPVLDALADLSADRPFAAPLRVWWVPTGLLSSLPVHAAGNGPGANVLDRCVSSYTSTVRSLLAARRRAKEAQPPPDGRMLLLSGAADLDVASGESSAVLTLVPDVHLVDGTAAGEEGVLAALAGASSVHLISHAVHNPVNPSLGYVELGDEDLGLTRISRLRPPHAWLAYLSACDTARPGPTLPDESLHIASAFHIAGYPHVVATIWPTADSAAEEVAQTFYQRLAYSGWREQPAVALCAAVRAARAHHPDQPLMWAPYLHSGA